MKDELIVADSKKSIMYRFGFIILLIAAVYGSSITHGFVWDDTFVIVNNPLVEKLGNIPRFFLSEDTIEESTGYYRPVTYISFALDRAVWGGNPAGFHFTNLVLHILVSLLLYRVIAALFNRERLAFVAALVFALHPVAGETVNFLAGGRNTLLSACFALLSLLFYIKDRKIAALASFTVAIFSKEFALLMPVIFLLYDYRLRQEKIRFSGYALYLIPTVCYLTLRSIAVQKANFLAAINMSDMATAPYLVVRYAVNMVFPVQLKVLYDVRFSPLMGILSLVVIIILTIVIYRFRKHDEVLFASSWFFLFLLPVINIIPLHTTTVMADRYAYFSLMGAALFLAAIICIWDNRAATVGVAALCLVYSLIAIGNTSAWKNELEFFTRMTLDAPGRFCGFKNLGMVYYRKGEIGRAMQNLEAGDSKPDITIKYLLGDAYIFWKENMPDKAEKALLRVLELEPGNLEPYLVLMMIHEQKGNSALAQTYRDKIKVLGHSVEQILIDRTVELCRTGETCMSKRQYIDAEVYFWQALRINPVYIPALIDMGNLRAEQGDFAGAVQYFNKALVLEPSNVSVHYNLATVYQMQGRFADSRQEMNRFKETSKLKGR
jgi:tetratricopeptide (TPR) repeat protein